VTASSIASPYHAPVAQLDRVSASEAEGHWFESSRARHYFLRRKDSSAIRFAEPSANRPIYGIAELDTCSGLSPVAGFSGRGLLLCPEVWTAPVNIDTGNN
jgi:hypothetical protein